MRTGLIVAVVAAACGHTPAGSVDAAGVVGSPPTQGCTVFPADNWWNRDISNDDVDPNSAAYIASIGVDKPLHADYGSIYGIPYALVGGAIPRSAVQFDYADESDPGPYPIPPDPPIEGGSDRHILMLEVTGCVLYELYAAEQLADGWHAGLGAIWDLKVNATRPDGWTSADAAGLPIYPGLVRYDEVVLRHEIRHALRFTANRTRKAHIFPAGHDASSITDANVPPMGIRVRLKKDVDISGFPPESQVVLTALKHYGMFLADNGSDWYVTGALDPRWNDDAVTAIRGLHGRDLEVVRPEPRP